MVTQSGCHLWRSQFPAKLTTDDFPALATTTAGILDRFKPMFPIRVSSCTVQLGPTHRVRILGGDNLPRLIVSRRPCLTKWRTDTGKMSQRLRHPCITVRTIWRGSQPHSFKVCRRKSVHAVDRVSLSTPWTELVCPRRGHTYVWSKPFGHFDPRWEVDPTP